MVLIIHYFPTNVFVLSISGYEFYNGISLKVQSEVFIQITTKNFLLDTHHKTMDHSEVNGLPAGYRGINPVDHCRLSQVSEFNWLFPVIIGLITQITKAKRIQILFIVGTRWLSTHSKGRYQFLLGIIIEKISHFIIFDYFLSNVKGSKAAIKFVISEKASRTLPS